MLTDRPDLLKLQWGTLRIRVAIALLVRCFFWRSPLFRPAGSRMPRLPDGKPNLNGIWQAMNTANWDLEEHAVAAGPGGRAGRDGAEPGGPGVVEGGEIPYLPAAKETEEGQFRAPPDRRSRNQVLPARRAARHLHAVSVPDLSQRQGDLLRLRISPAPCATFS